MLRALTFVVGGLLIGGAVLGAQDAVSEMRKTIDAQRAAAAAKDAKAYERFLADDLRWVNGDGTITSKQDRLKAVPTATDPPPTLGEADIRVSGDWATVVGISTASNGSRSRHARTYVKREGRWQLVLLAGVPMK